MRVRQFRTDNANNDRTHNGAHARAPVSLQVGAVLPSSTDGANANAGRPCATVFNEMRGLEKGLLVEVL